MYVVLQNFVSGSAFPPLPQRARFFLHYPSAGAAVVVFFLFFICFAALRGGTSNSFLRSHKFSLSLSLSHSGKVWIFSLFCFCVAPMFTTYIRYSKCLYPLHCCPCVCHSIIIRALTPLNVYVLVRQQVSACVIGCLFLYMCGFYNLQSFNLFVNTERYFGCFHLQTLIRNEIHTPHRL